MNELDSLYELHYWTPTKWGGMPATSREYEELRDLARELQAQYPVEGWGYRRYSILTIGGNCVFRAWQEKRT
jgi:hypothetical protein